MRPTKPVFQFSSIESNFEELKYIVEKLGGTLDETKEYSNRATHLIVGKMNFTEKLIGFIVAGKWILSQSYLKYSLKAKRFLDETSYHISEGFTLSQLAKVSKNWKLNIDNKLCDPPFKNWYVGCLIQNEAKAKALIRIIKAGRGSAVSINLNARSIRNTNQFTLIIHDDNLKMDAKNFADKLGLPCYPSQCIADYIMGCIYNPLPLIPIAYYDKLFSKAEEKNVDNETKVEENEKYSDSKNQVVKNEQNRFHFLFSFTTYLTYSKNNKKFMEFMDSSIESQVFEILWKLNAFEEALFLLNSVEFNKLPDPQYLNYLFQFLMAKKNSIQSFGSIKKDTLKITVYVYNSIISYILNILLLHPPDCHELVEYYKRAFQNLELKSRLNEDDITTYELKGLVDVLYILCVHDFLLLNNDKHLSNCALLLSKMIDDGSKKNLIKVMSNERRMIPFTTYEKVLQILSFCDKHFTESMYWKKVQDYLREQHGQEDINANHTNTIFKMNYSNRHFVSLFNFMLDLN